QSFCSILVHSLIPLSDSLRAVSAPAPGDVYTLSLHDALPIWPVGRQRALRAHPAHVVGPAGRGSPAHGVAAVGGDALSVGSHRRDRKSTRLNSSHVSTSYAVFCLNKKRRSSREASDRLGAFRR